MYIFKCYQSCGNLQNVFSVSPGLVFSFIVAVAIDFGHAIVQLIVTSSCVSIANMMQVHMLQYSLSVYHETEDVLVIVKWRWLCCSAQVPRKLAILQ